MIKDKLPVSVLKDVAIREHLVNRILRKHTLDPTTKLIHELGIHHGEFRVDLALINGSMHGFEIKSEADSLHRLASQADAFSAVFDKMTLVVALKHVDGALEMVPPWWGIEISSYDVRGQMKLRTIRRSAGNPSVDANALVKLLWRDEALGRLRALEVALPSRGLNRKYLYDALVAQVSLSHLRRMVRDTLKHRSAWRVAAPNA